MQVRAPRNISQAEADCGESDGRNAQSRNGEPRRKKKKCARQIKPMLGDGGVEGNSATHRQIGDDGEDETGKDRRILFSASPDPVNRRGDQQYSEDRLQFARRGLANARLGHSLGMRFHVAVHVEIEGEQNQSGIFRESAGHDDRPNEQWRRRAERRHGYVLSRQPKTQIDYGDKYDDHGRRPEFPPVLFQDKRRAPEEEENQTGFLAQSAQKEERAGCEQEEVASQRLGAQRANRAIQAKEAERRGEGIGPAGNVGNRRRLDRVNRPGEGREERDAPPFPFLHSE